MSKSEFLADFKNLLNFTNSKFTNFKTVSYAQSLVHCSTTSENDPTKVGLMFRLILQDIIAFSFFRSVVTK